MMVAKIDIKITPRMVTLKPAMIIEWISTKHIAALRRKRKS